MSMNDSSRHSARDNDYRTHFIYVLKVSETTCPGEGDSVALGR